MTANIRPGIHEDANNKIEKFFSIREQKIAKIWGNEWYVTSAGQVSLGNSLYKYLLVKAPPSHEEAFNLSREVAVIFSSYDKFQPRTLDAYEAVYKQFQEPRLERICYVLISNDENIANALSACLSNQESQIIVPFFYSHFFEQTSNPNFIRNQFRNYFYSKDTFDFSDPLKKDYYFFGRNGLVIEILEQHKNNLNSGLFGLRKTGKTSIIYDIIRKASQRDAVGIIIDCQDTAFNFRRWNFALYFVVHTICEQIQQQLEINITMPYKEEEFTEVNASALFGNCLKKINNEISQKSLLLLFDEIENITFGKSSSPHWCNDLDFIYFWQSIRSTFQTTANLFSFCILGTNPRYDYRLASGVLICENTIRQRQPR